MKFSGPICTALLLATVAAAHAATTKPNILIILADDLGWSDLGCYGGEIRTLDYARLVCPLWQSCRSMLARIDMLEERVAQLSAP